MAKFSQSISISINISEDNTHLFIRLKIPHRDPVILVHFASWLTFMVNIINIYSQMRLKIPLRFSIKLACVSQLASIGSVDY